MIYRITEKDRYGAITVREVEAGSFDDLGSNVLRTCLSIEELDEFGDVVQGIYPEDRSREVHE